METCEKCDREFILGVDGVGYPVNLCDECAGVTRTREGHVIPGEHATFLDIATGKKTVIRAGGKSKPGRGRSQ